MDSRGPSNEGDPSATYDSKIPMNGGSSAHRKRLDRCLIYVPEGEDYWVEIEESNIPEGCRVYVEGALIRWKGTKHWHENVPVNPSDHFALSSKISFRDSC